MAAPSIDELRRMSPAEQAAYITQSMHMLRYDKPKRAWLDTGSKYLNRVFGSEELGVRYGSVLALAGKQSAGKTLVAAMLAGLAQQDGAVVGWVDVEESFDGPWVKIHGLDPGKKLPGGGYSKIALFAPGFGEFKSKKKKGETGPKGDISGLRLETAEEMFERAEVWMKLQRKLNPNCKVVMVVDSTTAVQPEEELEAGFTKQNMRTKLLAPFLNRLAKRWTGLAPNINALIIFISQIRTNPGMMFGNPEYMPGGNGILFYPHNITWVTRIKHGSILSPKGDVVGLISRLSNKKNKVGGGSIEFKKCAFAAHFRENKWRFMGVKKAEALAIKQKKSKEE